MKQPLFFQFFHHLGGSFLFLLRVLKCWTGSVSQKKALFQQIALISSRSASIVIVSGFFVGAILVFQLRLILIKYDALRFLGGLNTSTLVREIGPLLISFLLAGKIGSYLTAELGSMRVTEQIDAMECFGKNPLEYLVLPRILGVFFASILLLFLGLFSGLMGSLIGASLVSGINFFQYLVTVPKFLSMTALIGAFLKSGAYGIVIGTVACEKGFYAGRGAQGVGAAVTQGAAYMHFYILLTTFFFSYFLRAWEVFFNGISS